jgi:hypothetical protein
MSSKQGLRTAGMRTSASAEGSLRSNGAPTGLLLARDTAGLRNTGHKNPLPNNEESA